MDTHKHEVKENSEQSYLEHCSTLDVSPGASEQEISDSYFRLKKAYGGSSGAMYSLIPPEEAENCLQEIEEAYHCLMARSRVDGLQQQQSGVARAAATALSGEGVRESAGDPDLAEQDGHYRMLGAELPVEPGGERAVTTTKAARSLFAASALDTALRKQAEEIILGYKQEIDGSLFRKIRQLLHVSETELQDHVKVSIGHIRAIEENQFDILPPLVYTKGFLSSYLRYLAVPNPERIINPYLNKMKLWQERSEK
ncbi:MAG: helix-turn-helix domain-containing protein [Zetaproteobacteria bacterium]|nr:helix-turn-helix domain-containing protein [Zetaproteobacteria bacterium]